MSADLRTLVKCNFKIKNNYQNYCLQNHIRATRSAPVIFGNPAHSLLLSPSHIISVSNVVVRSLSRLTLQPHGVQHTRVSCPISNRCRHMIHEPESHLETYLECVLEKVWVFFFFFLILLFLFQLSGFYSVRSDSRRKLGPMKFKPDYCIYHRLFAFTRLMFQTECK